MDSYEKTVIWCLISILAFPLLMIMMYLLKIGPKYEDECTCCKKHRPQVQIERLVKELKAKNIIKSNIQNPPEGW